MAGERQEEERQLATQGQDRSDGRQAPSLSLSPLFLNRLLISTLFTLSHTHSFSLSPFCLSCLSRAGKGSARTLFPCHAACRVCVHMHASAAQSLLRRHSECRACVVPRPPLLCLRRRRRCSADDLSLSLSLLPSIALSSAVPLRRQ